MQNLLIFLCRTVLKTRDLTMQDGRGQRKKQIINGSEENLLVINRNNFVILIQLMNLKACAVCLRIAPLNRIPNVTCCINLLALFIVRENMSFTVVNNYVQLVFSNCSLRVVFNTSCNSIYYFLLNVSGVNSTRF